MTSPGSATGSHREFPRERHDRHHGGEPAHRERRIDAVSTVDFGNPHRYEPISCYSTAPAMPGVGGAF
jgi:hypothetical protein